MTRRNLHNALVGVRRLGVDTNCIIYFVQAHPDFDALVSKVFHRISMDKMTGNTSAMSLIETLIVPVRTDDLSLRQEFRALLLRGHNFHTIPVSSAIAERAAEIRALYILKAPDAVQVSTELETSCDAFLTNNGDHLKRVTKLSVLVLNGLEL